MTPSKRLTDIVLALVLGALLALPMLALTLILWLGQGRPVFHRSERMRTPTQSFRLCKFRTMTVAPDDSGVSGGDKDCRITPLGHLLRRTRLDEVPQLWNILRGDMSFVGPRPPLGAYVRRFPALYGRVLVSRPGLTGLATLHFHRHEARLLARCRTPAETDAVYARRCIPRKARLDLIYQRHRTIALDARLLAATAAQVLRWPRHRP
jgi:lipopolysaccharide/colanic/teichoic acid biosynthesis glycosyltransferase